jgi:hypothetical protein
MSGRTEPMSLKRLRSVRRDYNSRPGQCLAHLTCSPLSSSAGRRHQRSRSLVQTMRDPNACTATSSGRRRRSAPPGGDSSSTIRGTTARRARACCPASGSWRRARSRQPARRAGRVWSGQSRSSRLTAVARPVAWPSQSLPDRFRRDLSRPCKAAGIQWVKRDIRASHPPYGQRGYPDRLRQAMPPSSLPKRIDDAAAVTIARHP